MKKYYPDRNCLNFLRVILAVITLGLFIAINYFLDSYIPIKNGLMIFVGTLFALVALIGLPLYFNQAAYYVSGQEIVRSAGFFIRNREFMRSSAVQYVTLIRTPFSRGTGLNFVLINALGGHMILPFLSRRDAEDILRVLTEALQARPL